jgi:hypothetical protein
MQYSEFSKSVQVGWRWWRTTFPHGGRRGSRTTLAVGIIFIVASLLSPMGSNLQARIAMTGVGAMSAVLVLARPQSFWENGRVEGWRWFFGDRGVIIIYVAIAAFFIGIAWFYPL